MLSKLMRWTENCNSCSQHKSTERAHFFSMTMFNHTLHNQRFNSWKLLQSFASSTIFTWPLISWLSLQTSRQTFCRENTSTISRRQKLLSKSSLNPKALIFLKNKFIHFNWMLITLQYCSGFAIHWHESATDIHVFHIWTPLPPPSPSHPSGSSQCTSPKHPVQCIEPGLVIHFTYDNIHVSMLFFQIITPLPSPTESKRLFYTSVSLLLSCI